MVPLFLFGLACKKLSVHVYVYSICKVVDTVHFPITSVIYSNPTFLTTLKNVTENVCSSIAASLPRGGSYSSAPISQAE